jgi:hypothetical protein
MGHPDIGHCHIEIPIKSQLFRGRMYAYTWGQMDPVGTGGSSGYRVGEARGSGEPTEPIRLGGTQPRQPREWGKEVWMWNGIS